MMRKVFIIGLATFFGMFLLRGLLRTEPKPVDPNAGVRAFGWTVAKKIIGTGRYYDWESVSFEKRPDVDGLPDRWIVTGRVDAHTWQVWVIKIDGFKTYKARQKYL